MCTVVISFAFSLETQADTTQDYAIQDSDDFEIELLAPISKWWYEVGPLPYSGRTKYIETSRHGQCLDGYIAARNIGGGLYMYEGYLYPCGGHKPIPTKDIVEEENE